MRQSGCDVPEWMLQVKSLKELKKKNHKRIKTAGGDSNEAEADNLLEE
jgi:hypothetical protein